MNGMQGQRRLGEIMDSGGEGLGPHERAVFDAMAGLGNAGPQDAERAIAHAVEACLGYYAPAENAAFGRVV